MLTRSLLSGQSIRQSDVRNVMLMTETLPASRPTIRAEDSCDDGLRVCSANHHAVSISHTRPVYSYAYYIQTDFI